MTKRLLSYSFSMLSAFILFNPLSFSAPPLAEAPASPSIGISADLGGNATSLNDTFLMAAKNGNLQTVSTLLSQPGLNINVKTQDADGNSALMLAAKNGGTPIVEVLLQNHADVNLANNLGHTAYILAAENNHIDIVQMLIHAGANINQTDNQGYSALMLAVKNDHLETAQYLITAAKADVNLVTYLGQTALMLAALFSTNNYLGIATLLLGVGANQNHADHQGFTALMHAVISSNETAVEHLITTAKVDLNFINYMGHTALKLAENSKFFHAIWLLRENNAKGGCLTSGCCSSCKSPGGCTVQ